MIELTDYQLRVWLAQWPAVQRAVLDKLRTRTGTPTVLEMDMLGWLTAMSVQVDRVKQVIEKTE
jgi:hypothetical protein